MKDFRVGVFEHPRRRGITLMAYTMYFNPDWDGCCLHSVSAVNGAAAKKLATAEHRERCMASEVASPAADRKEGHVPCEAVWICARRDWALVAEVTNPRTREALSALVEKWRAAAEDGHLHAYELYRQQRHEKFGYERGFADARRIASDELAAALLLAEAHRCSGCNLRWEGPLHGAELCGDCWRTAQPVLLSEAAPPATEKKYRKVPDDAPSWVPRCICGNAVLNDGDKCRACGPDWSEGAEARRHAEKQRELLKLPSSPGSGQPTPTDEGTP